MENLLAILVLASMAALVLGLIKPGLVLPGLKTPTRGKAAAAWTVICVASLAGLGISAETRQKSNLPAPPDLSHPSPNPSQASGGSSLPRYDVDAHCKVISEVGGTGSQMILQGCYQQEQMHYDRTKQIWDDLPKQMRSHCDQIARAGGGSYMILAGCIDQEKASAQSNQNFKFNR